MDPKYHSEFLKIVKRFEGNCEKARKIDKVSTEIEEKKETETPTVDDQMQQKSEQEIIDACMKSLQCTACNKLQPSVSRS